MEVSEAHFSHKPLIINHLNKNLMKQYILNILSKGDAMINVAVYFTNLSDLKAEEAIKIAEEIGNDNFTKRLKESYGIS